MKPPDVEGAAAVGGVGAGRKPLSAAPRPRPGNPQNVREERVDIALRRVKGGHPSNHRIGIVPYMEEPVPLQFGDVTLVQPSEDRICLHRIHDLNARNIGEARRQPGGHRVSMPGVAQPQVVLEQRDELRREEPHLR